VVRQAGRQRAARARRRRRRHLLSRLRRCWWRAPPAPEVRCRIGGRRPGAP
jgi:hypothetical protein